MMYPEIKKYILELTLEFGSIPESRKIILDQITRYISEKKSAGRPVNLVYICTHNSRRSHFGQVWAHVAASFYHIENVYSYSGGTEATAFNINAIQALRRVGFVINQINNPGQPSYQVFHAEDEAPSVCFSKVYNNEANPVSGFAAIMTCSDAEENCPFIPGVELRIGTTYEDPKAFDNTPGQDSAYDERCRQIALETLYVFSNV